VLIIRHQQGFANPALSTCAAALVSRHRQTPACCLIMLASQMLPCCRLLLVLCLSPGISKVQDDEVGDGTTSGVTAAQAASNNAACCHFC
jgi:hypothetical protein